MVYGALSPAHFQGGSGLQGLRDITFGRTDGLGERQSTGQPCRDGTRECAARAMGVARGDSRSGEFGHLPTVHIEPVGLLGAFPMAALDEQLPAAAVQEETGGSGRLGVSSVACGSSCRQNASSASGRMRRPPVVATITGSTTKCFTLYNRRVSATASTVAASATMPTFTASGRRSSITARIWAATIGGLTGSIALTPSVFCAVTAVTTEAA